MPSLDSGSPVHAMNASVGPLSTCPPTSGETATTGAGQPRSASRIPGTARIGPIEMTGFDGPTITARARRARPRPPALGAAASAPRNATSSTGPAAPSRIMNAWNGRHAPRALTHVRTGASAIGSTRAGTPSARRSSSIAVGERRALGQPPRPREADREVLVAEVEPDVLAERAQRVHHARTCRRAAPSRARRSGRPARTSRGPGRARRGRRGSRCRRRCWRSRRGPRRRRRASRARAWRRRCRRPRTTTGPLTGR